MVVVGEIICLHFYVSIFLPIKYFVMYTSIVLMRFSYEIIQYERVILIVYS